VSTQSLTNVEAIAGFMTIDQPSRRSGDFKASEEKLLHATAVAETAYGAFHGEVAVILMKLADLYRCYGHFAEAANVEDRISEIAATYLEDQRYSS
jgi:hypothetical protein